MRIVRAEVLEYVRQLDGRSWNPVSRWTERRAPIVVVETDDGLRGQGEAWSRQEEIGRVLDALARSLRSSVVGRSFDDADAIASLGISDAADAADAADGVDAAGGVDWPQSAAASAIDIALWDALARTRRCPLWKMLGSPSGPVRVYASGGLYRDGCNARDLAREIARYRDEGFRDVKIKVGGSTLAADVERIAAARSAMASEGVLWVDAVNRLHSGNALDCAIAYREAGAGAIQAPVAFDDDATMARIGRDALPVIAGESAFGIDTFERLLDGARVALLQLNVGLCGGFTGATRIARIAASRGVPVTVQAHGTAVLLDASLQWGAANHAQSVEFHRFHDHLQDAAWMASHPVHSGAIALPDSAGGNAIVGGDVACADPLSSVHSIHSID